MLGTGINRLNTVTCLAPTHLYSPEQKHTIRPEYHRVLRYIYHIHQDGRYS
jgi:hypothetical protein